LSAEDILDRLEGVRQCTTDSWVARCPAHEDRSPSLTVRDAGDGMVLMHCFTGCDVTAIVESIGLELSALFPPRSPDEHRRRSLRKPFPASAVLSALASEALIASMAATTLARGEKLGAADRERLQRAATRLEEGARYG
jgi:hypothetical protein